MSILFIMIPISILLAFSFLGLFIWSNNTGQFEDLITPSLVMLDEGEPISNDEEEGNDRGKI